MKSLKYLRVLVAVGMFSLVTLFFLGLVGGCGVLEKIQFVPALLGCAGGAFAVPLVAWLVGTLVFGRVYCSWVCPLGILQDVLACVLHRRKYSPMNGGCCAAVRAASLAAWLVVLLAFGASLAGLLDPYSVFGRIASQLLLPAADRINNLLAGWLGHEGAVVLFRREVFVRGAEGLAVAVGSFALLCALVAWKGRIFCNTVCPAGAMLSALSVRTALRIAIDPAKCVKCGLCSGACKVGCLDGKNLSVDNSRCVRCFNCIGVCAKGAISFSPAWMGGSVPVRGEERRALVAAASAGIAAAVLSGRLPKFGETKKGLPPPGASVDRLRTLCTACGLCVAKCPNKVLAPAGASEYGVLGFLIPKMDYSRGFCDPGCTKCGEVCPTGAIPPLDLAGKGKVKIGLARIDEKVCIACAEKAPCSLCERRCPHKAVTMKEREVMEGGKSVKVKMPSIDEGKCTGCGACEHYCPVRAIKVGHHL